MKVLITTATRPDTLASYYTRYLQQIRGIRIIPAYTFDIERKYEFTGIRGRLYANYFPELIGNKVTTYLLEKVNEVKPDVILIFKGMYIIPGALRQLRRMGIRLVNYNPDHPIFYDSPGSGNRLIRKSLKYYNLIYTYSPRIKDQIANSGVAGKIEVLPFGFVPSRYNSNRLSDLPRRNRICFVGIGDRGRCEMIYRICKAGFPVDVFGTGYESLLNKINGSVKIYPPVFGDQYHAILQSYDVQLNMFRPQNRDAHNMRTFEIPAVGGIQLCEYSLQCQGFFEQDKEIFMYVDFHELGDRLEKLLSMSSEMAVDYRMAARRRCIAEDYSYSGRAQQLVGQLKALF